MQSYHFPYQSFLKNTRKSFLKSSTPDGVCVSSFIRRFAEALKTSIERSNIDDGLEILFEYFNCHASVQTLREYCEVVRLTQMATQSVYSELDWLSIFLCPLHSPHDFGFGQLSFSWCVWWHHIITFHCAMEIWLKLPNVPLPLIIQTCPYVPHAVNVQFPSGHHVCVRL